MAKKEKEIEEKTDKLKEKALEILRADLMKRFGERIVEPVEVEEDFKGECIGTGILTLDRALGRPIPRGRVTEIYGPESSGKTTLLIRILIQAQLKWPDKRVAVVDAEHAFDIEYAKALGLKISNDGTFDIFHPVCGEEAIDIVEALVRSGLYSVVAVDSVAALVPMVEVEGEMKDANMGVHARLMSKAMRKLVAPCAISDTSLIFTNQIRMKIGIMFGNPETVTGGNALKFYCTQRIETRKGEPIKDGDRPIGCNTKIKIVKNKVAPPMLEAYVDLIYGQGFSAERDIIKLATELNVIEKSGSWYSYKGEKLGQGFDNTVEFLKDNPKLVDEVAKLVIGILKK